MASRKLKVDPEIAKVRDLSSDGAGICETTGKLVFVPDALPGETVRIQRKLRKRQHDEGELLEVIEPSPHRVEPACAHFGVCGGCALQHLSGSAQLETKQKWLLDNLRRIGTVAPERILAPLTSQSFGYRRRGRLGLRYVFKKERLLIGFRERAGRYLADLQTCAVLDPRVGNQLQSLVELVGGLSIMTHVPQIEFAVGSDTVAYVLRHLQPLTSADENRLTEFARDNRCEMFVQPGGPETVRLLYPVETQLAYRLDPWGLEMRFAPADFVQVNDDINARMIRLSMELLAVEASDVVLDLFCGLGNFTLALAKQAASVTGVEGASALVAKARDNASRNKVENVSFNVADLASPPDSQLSWVKTSYDKILLDPPRSGAAAMIDFLGRSDAKRIVYVSCNPATLARDAGELVNRFNYRLEAAGVMDMFPHTTHVESIALFVR